MCTWYSRTRIGSTSVTSSMIGSTRDQKGPTHSVWQSKRAYFPLERACVHHERQDGLHAARQPIEVAGLVRCHKKCCAHATVWRVCRHPSYPRAALCYSRRHSLLRQKHGQGYVAEASSGHKALPLTLVYLFVFFLRYFFQGTCGLVQVLSEENGGPF